MAQPSYGHTVKGQLFTVTHEILEAERGISVFEGGDVMRWRSNEEVFGVEATLNNVKVKYGPHKRSFWLSAMEVEIDDEILGIHRETKGSLNGDVFAQYMLEQLMRIRSHPHEICLDMHKQAVEERERLLTAGTRLSWKR